MSGNTLQQIITQTILYQNSRNQRKRLRKIARDLDLKKIPKKIVIPTEYMVNVKK